MLTPRHLHLKRVSLKSPSEWTHDGEALVFLFPEAGAGRYTSGRSVSPLRAGDVVVLGAGSQGKLRPVGAEFVFQCFAARIEHLSPLFVPREMGLLRRVVQGFGPAKRYPGAGPLAGACRQLLGETPHPSGVQHRSHLLRIVAAILGREWQAVPVQPAGLARADERLIQTLGRLAPDDILDLSVEALSHKLGFGVRHLNRVFQRRFGFSVGALKMEMRLVKGLALLRDPRLPVINVANQCGFRCLGLFNTCFKRRFGASPSQCRKQLLLQEIEPDNALLDNRPWTILCNGLCPWSANGRAR